MSASPPTVRTTQSTRRALLVLLLAALGLVLLVLRPFAQALFLGGVLAMVLLPVHRRFARLVRGERLSAGLLVAGVVLLGLGPLVAFSAFLVAQAAEAVTFVSGVLRREGGSGLLERLPDSLEGAVRWGLARLPEDSLDQLAEGLRNRAGAAGGAAVGAVGGAVRTAGSFVFQTVMMLLALFFFLTGRDQLLEFVDDASPLRKGQTRELISEFRSVVRAVFLSSVVTAAVQAAVALAGYLVAKVPFPVFFTALTFVIAFIPAVGAASVVLVTALLMLATGHPWAALYLGIWAVAVVGLVDNVIKPLVIRSGMHLHGAVVFFALLGGLAAFGTVGLVLGPLSVALFLALLRIYQRDYAADPRDREAMQRRVEAEAAAAGKPPPPSAPPSAPPSEPPAPPEPPLHS